MKSNPFKCLTDKLKSMFPSQLNTDDVRMVMQNGQLCVKSSENEDEFVAIDAQGELVSYPKELTIKVPVLIMSKPVNTLAVGDIIKGKRSYSRVTAVNGTKITSIGYTGANKTTHAIKDFLLNQSFVQVVVSMVGSFTGTGINPMFLAAIMKSEEDGESLSIESMLPYMMMGGGMMGQNAQPNGMFGGINPMLLLLADKKEGSSSMKDLMLMSALPGMLGGVAGANSNPFANMFGAWGGQAPVQAQGNEPKPAENNNQPGNVADANANAAGDANK